jgi:uncharacterized PurR-regulated membrane protein YhhQ (DUF165 family)
VSIDRATLDRSRQRTFIALGFSIALVLFILLYAAFKYPHSRPLYAAIMLGYLAAIRLIAYLQRP